MPTIDIDEDTREYISPKSSSNPRHYMLYKMTPKRLLLPTGSKHNFHEVLKILGELSTSDLWLCIEIKEEKKNV